MEPNDFIVRELDEMKADIKEIRQDVSKLLAFKWQIIGGSLVLSAFVTIVLQVVLSRN